MSGHQPDCADLKSASTESPHSDQDAGLRPAVEAPERDAAAAAATPPASETTGGAAITANADVDDTISGSMRDASSSAASAPSAIPHPTATTDPTSSPSAAPAAAAAGNNNTTTKFICGVVEGFYGRPWTTEQRKDLFGKLRRWGMCSYVYAPKDDYKHRAYWRELYTVEEGDHLAGLIAAAKEHNVAFYYALSPGLDMTYSSPKEVATLKRKLDQVARFGCEAFALLFDDIESEMTKADKEVFQTFAHAQVTITNEIYHHLRCRRFLFCPTQYCSSRAVPTVGASDYLLTIGAKLSLDIDVLWTGPKVISKELTQEQLQEVTDVLRRPPVIWDNIHANDYDQKRVFLGPYSGRSPDIIPMLRGVLTNPNCEFHANAIAIHTLAHWSRCRTDGRRLRRHEDGPAEAQRHLETGNSDDAAAEAEEAGALVAAAGDDMEPAASGVYHPRAALRQAIREWLGEFAVAKDAYGPISKPQPAAVTMVMPVLPIIPSVNTCMSLTTTSTTTTTTTQCGTASATAPGVCATAGCKDAACSVSASTAGAATAATAVASAATSVLPMNVPEVNTSQLQALAEVCSVITGTESIALPNLVMNSLVSSTTIVTNTAIPNPIVSAGIEAALPSIPVPVSSIGIPIANVAVHSDAHKRQDEAMPEAAAAAETSAKLNGSDDASMGDGLDIGGGAEPIALDTDTESSGKLNGSDDASMGDGVAEPMEVAPSLLSPKHGASKAASLLDDVVMAENVSSASSSASSMQVECSDASLPSAEMPSVEPSADEETTSPTTANDDDYDDYADAERAPISAEDISLMCDLFYLPFEHGQRALRLLNEFNWLKTNALVLTDRPPRGACAAPRPEIQEWHRRADRFYALGRSVLVLAKKLALCENRELAYELFAYVWDIAGVITLLTGYVKWLALGSFPRTINTFTQAGYTWFSKGWRETFSSGDQEPWVFRGGLTADLQRLIPIDSGNDLFLYKLPDQPSTRFPTIRPYRHADEPRVYSICHRTCRDGSDCSDLFPPGALQAIPADRLIGPFVTLVPELCLVVGDSAEMMGYASAALDAKEFYRQQEMCWMPAMRAKYPLALLSMPAERLTLTAAETIRHFHNFRYECPAEVLCSHPSIMTCCVLKEQFIADQSTAKRLVTVLLAALRANGSSGVHACINNTDRFLHQFYSKLGFVELCQEPSGKVYMGRNF